MTLWIVLRFFSKDSTKYYINHPKQGDIYIFSDNENYAPMRLDSMDESKYFMRNYIFLFSEAIPRKKQIIDSEFDLNFYAIYEAEEINRLNLEGNIIIVYR